MSVSQIPGATRLRRHQYGPQSALNTAVAATRRVPWRGAIKPDPQWTDPDIDTGSLDPVVQPYSAGLEITADMTGAAFYDDMPIRDTAGLMGGVTPSTSGTAYIWDFQVASLTSDVFDPFTHQYGDDTEATDGIIGIGGVIDSWEEDSTQEVGPWQISDSWFYSTVTLGSDLTNSLDVDDDGVLIMSDETEVKMDTAYGSIGTTKLTDTVHQVILRGQNNLDKKRFLNGSNGTNKLGGLGRGERVIELVLVVAKTSAMITEAATLLTRPRPKRYFEVLTTSPLEASTGVPYSRSRRGAFRLFDREDVEIGGNACIQLTYHAYYDRDLGYAYKVRTVNKQATVAAAPA